MFYKGTYASSEVMQISSAFPREKSSRIFNPSYNQTRSRIHKIQFNKYKGRQYTCTAFYKDMQHTPKREHTKCYSLCDIHVRCLPVLSVACQQHKYHSHLFAPTLTRSIDPVFIQAVRLLMTKLPYFHNGYNLLSNFLQIPHIPQRPCNPPSGYAGDKCSIEEWMDKGEMLVECPTIIILYEVVV